MIYFIGTVPHARTEAAYKADLKGLWECERLSGSDDLWEPQMLDYLVKDTAKGMGLKLPGARDSYAPSRLGLLAVFASPLAGDVPPEVVGYVAWEDKHKNSSLLSIAVHPRHRRQGLGRWLMAEAVDLVQRQMGLVPAGETNPTRKLFVKVRARSVVDQIFLKRCGFECYRLGVDGFEDPPDDAYYFRLQLSPCPCPDQSPLPLTVSQPR